MTPKRAASILLGATIVGVFFGVVLSGDDVISARVWLGAAAVTIIAILVRDLIAASSLQRATFTPAWSLRRQRHVSPGPQALENTHSVLLSAQSSPRAHGLHLRPRLQDLAGHYLPIRHGIDVAHDPARATDALGDVAWLIDPSVNDRTPTTAEIERFLDVILDGRGGSSSTGRSEGREGAS